MGMWDKRPGRWIPGKGAHGDVGQAARSVETGKTAGFLYYWLCAVCFYLFTEVPYDARTAKCVAVCFLVRSSVRVSSSPRT
jgi:hypothetical protein